MSVRRLVRWPLWLAIGLAALVLAVAACFFWTRPRPLARTEIFAGVTYTCEELSADAEGSGLMHLVEVDLAAPGIELYVTPKDPDAVARGWQYRLRWTPFVASEEDLSVVVNATLFGSESGWVQWPGDWARSIETAVAEHEVNHVSPNSYLLWFEDDLTPHLEKRKPPPAEALRRARWGVSSEIVILSDGKVNAWAGRRPEPQIMAGIDPGRNRLFLAVFAYASPARAARRLAEHGVVDAISLDSGHSAGMTIGRGARGVRSGTLLWPTRAVATHFGVRAATLKMGDMGRETGL